MRLTVQEVQVLVNTINPIVEYYRQQSNQPLATREDLERFIVLETLQAKLEKA